MRENFDLAFQLTIGLEGKPTNDPRDKGGFTIWGLAKKWHPEIDKNTTIDYAKGVYLKDYWIPNKCDDYPFPMDVCLFDSCVNPQNDPKIPGCGNNELLSLKPQNWQDYQLLRMERYLRVSQRCYVDGHVFRVLRLNMEIRKHL